MATIRERSRADGTIAYNVLWPDVDSGSRKQVSRTFTIKSEAEELLQFLNANGNSFSLASKGVIAKRSKAPTVRQAIEHHIERLGGEVEPGTIRSYRGMVVTHFTDSEVSRIPIDMLTPADVRRWFDNHPRSVKTKKNLQALLSASLARAVDDGTIASNPAKGIKGPKTVKKSREPVFLTRDEALAITANIDQHYALFVKLLLGTGLRFGEATALTPSDFARVSGRLAIRVSGAWKRHGGDGIGVKLGAPKTLKGVRTVTLSPTLATEVSEFLKSASRKELIFRHPNTNGRILNSTFHEYVWQPLIASLIANGDLLERPTVHDLRHTHASWLIEKGVPLPVIQARLGHESIQTTVGTYGHLANDADAKAADLLD